MSEQPAASRWSVYMLLCADGTLYTGIATDVPRRVAQHNGERAGGARYTNGRRPVALVWQAEAADRSQALRREAAIKKLSRAQKMRLIRDQPASAADSSSSACC